MSTSRTKNSIRNIFWVYFNTFISLILNFANRTIFIHYLGIEFLGINGLFGNILTILSLADLGFGTAMAYSYYKPIAEGDTEKVVALNCFYKKLYRYIALAIFIVGILLIPFLKYIVNTETEIEHLNIYYLLTLIGIVASYLMVYKSTLLNAYQMNYVVSKYNSIIKCFITVVQIAFMVTTRNYIVYLIIIILGNVVNNIRVSMAADKYFPFIRENKILPSSEKKDIFNNIKSVFIYKISGVLINGTDNILISTIIGTVWVGYYSNYLIIINNINNLINMVFTSMTASVGNLIVKENSKKRLEVFNAIQTISFWFSTVITSCVYLLINIFIKAWLGEQFLLDSNTVIAITINLYLVCILQPVWIYREAAGIYIKTKYVMLVTAILNVVLSIMWGYIWGLSGILFASAAAKLVTYVWYEPVLLFNEYMNGKVHKYFLKVVGNVIAVIGISFVISRVINLVCIEGFIGFFVKGFICFTMANLFYAIYFIKSDSANIIKNRIKNFKLIRR